ncbi:unnamed protein product [Allacma fusca]|uniref:Glycoprotein hormone subunit beta domain-containing protein n=1 Tax=Allacma fusca TaxID=39272 RepID=A0A8J2PZ34_9HEXA|nr:unnamed protein product [Allacma fusca]
MWPEFVTIVLLLCLSQHFSPVVADQDHVSQEDLLATLLGDDDSPPLSAEGGVTILGTGAVDPATTLDCHRRLYSYRVTKTDSAGRTCWDQVNVRSCWGRCDSNEIPDWRFPYKRSHHPVCIYGSRHERTVTLRNCQPDVEPGTDKYTFQEAETCVCTACKSSEASCEGLRYRGVRSGFRSN